MIKEYTIKKEYGDNVAVEVQDYIQKKESEGISSEFLGLLLGKEGECTLIFDESLLLDSEVEVC